MSSRAFNECGTCKLLFESNEVRIPFVCDSCRWANRERQTFTNDTARELLQGQRVTPESLLDREAVIERGLAAIRKYNGEPVSEVAQQAPYFAHQDAELQRNLAQRAQDPNKCRIADLEWQNDGLNKVLNGNIEKIVRIEADLARKRDECLRLEKQLADQSKLCEFHATDANVTRFTLAEVQLENSRLRRELGKKR
jgi:hypothetical protein